MRAINHALTGSLIGLSIGKPLIAIPLAFISHFICDVIPHYAGSLPDELQIKSRLFKALLIIDAVLCVSLVVLLAFTKPEHWLLAAITAFVATSPDFLFVQRFTAAQAGKNHQTGAVVTFTRTIQWFQRPIGVVVEIAWLVGASLLLSTYLLS